jgi:hypothetical protein
MLSTLLLLVAVWALTVPAVLGLGRLLGRLSAPRAVAPPLAEPVVERSDNVVPLLSRPQNELQRRAA